MNISKYNNFYYGAAPFTVATGGTITTSGDYKIHTFLSSDNFVVSNLGTAPNNVVEYLIISGGGGSAGTTAGVGAGGEGGVIEDKTQASVLLAPIELRLVDMENDSYVDEESHQGLHEIMAHVKLFLSGVTWV